MSQAHKGIHIAGSNQQRGDAPAADRGEVLADRDAGHPRDLIRNPLQADRVQRRPQVGRNSGGQRHQLSPAAFKKETPLQVDKVHQVDLRILNRTTDLLIAVHVQRDSHVGAVRVLGARRHLQALCRVAVAPICAMPIDRRRTIASWPVIRIAVHDHFDIVGGYVHPIATSDESRLVHARTQPVEQIQALNPHRKQGTHHAHTNIQIVDGKTEQVLGRSPIRIVKIRIPQPHESFHAASADGSAVNGPVSDRREVIADGHPGNFADLLRDRLQADRVQRGTHVQGDSRIELHQLLRTPFQEHATLQMDDVGERHPRQFDPHPKFVDRI